MNTNEIKQDKPLSKPVELLVEIREICEQNNIDYYLGPNLVIRALRSGVLEELVDPVVYMTLDNCLRFIEAVNKAGGPGRALEYMGNSDTYPSFSVNYVDENSTYIMVSRGNDFSRSGKRVTVNILREDINNTFANMIETGWENDAFNPPLNLTGKKKTAITAVHMIKRMKSNPGKWTFSYLCKVYGNASAKQYFVRPYRRPRVYLPKSLFQETEDITIEGESFAAPRNCERYLELFYGEDWRRAALIEKREQFTISSDTIPYRDYIRQLEESGITIDSIFDSYLKALSENRGNEDIVKSKDRAFTVAKRSGDRMMLYEQLYPQIDRIRELRAEKKYDELTVLFRDYTRLAKEYLKEDLALSPSEELLEIECEILEYNGDSARSEKLKQLAPEQHKKPLCITPGEN